MAQSNSEKKAQELLAKRTEALTAFGISVTQEILEMSSQKFTSYIKKLTADQAAPAVDNKTTEAVEEKQEPKVIGSEDEEKTAKRIMRQMDVDAVFATTDGYWFTQKDLAALHQAKLGGQYKVFTNKTK